MNAYKVGQRVTLNSGTQGTIKEVYRAGEKGAQRDMGFYLFANAINGTTFTVGHTEIARATAQRTTDEQWAHDERARLHDGDPDAPAVMVTPQQCQQQQANAGAKRAHVGHPSFDVSDSDFEIISKIAARAVSLARDLDADYDQMTACMDLSACVANGCPLRLEDLLAADDGNFGHDVFGIRRHIDRETGRLGDCFLPRFAKIEIGAQ